MFRGSGTGMERGHHTVVTMGSLALCLRIFSDPVTLLGSFGKSGSIYSGMRLLKLVNLRDFLE